MNIVVLLAGVLDPKWPVAPEGQGLPARPADRLILSPFDEAALELALKIRDARPEAVIRACVMGGEDAVKLARGVAAFNIADVSAVQIADMWNQSAVAPGLAGACTGADLVLIGREFGDSDDGLVPPLLAGLLGLPFLARAQALESGASLQLLRETGAFEERVCLDRPLVASVTNDRRTRLRKPLMKNVMMARQFAVPVMDAQPAPVAEVELVGAQELAGTRVPVSCRILTGTPAQQADELAQLLLEVQP